MQFSPLRKLWSFFYIDAFDAIGRRIKNKDVIVYFFVLKKRDV